MVPRSAPKGILEQGRFQERRFGGPASFFGRFWAPSKSEGAPKTTRKIQYGDFLVPLGGQKANKNNVLVGIWKDMNF